jgi:DnaJ-class molecular chaperone
MESGESFYSVLGVSKQASKDEIKKAYRTLQMKFHPDRNIGSEEAHTMTQKINEAYETLSDDQKRAEYDMMQSNPFMRMNSHGPHNEVPIDEIFQMMFGGFGGPGIRIFHGGSNMNMNNMNMNNMNNMNMNNMNMNIMNNMNKPVPIIHSLSLSLEQVYKGGSFPVEIERWVLENNTKMFEHETVYVDVSPGIDDHEIIILRDRGNVISEHCKGDIKITIVLTNTTPFKRIGLDLVIEKKITLKESLCGFSFEIDHINGKNYTLNNQKGKIIPPEYKKIYNDMGMIRGENRGNMIIHFHVEFPEMMTMEQIDALSGVLP